MKNMTLANIATACGGTYFGTETDKDREIAGAVIDNRLVEKDYLFIAIKGARVDGHSFIPAAFGGRTGSVIRAGIRESGRTIYLSGILRKRYEENCKVLPPVPGY